MIIQSNNNCTSWKFSESFIFTSGLIAVGFLIEFFSGGKGFVMPAWPYNIIAIFVFICLIILCIILIKHNIINWLSGIYTALPAIIFYSVLLLLSGFITQHFYNEAETLYKASLHIYTDKFGLTHIINSWPFVLISIFLITVLSFTILKRIKIFTWRNLTFLLNHCGLWVIIVAASAGSGDIKKFSMKVFEKEKTNKVYDDSGNIYQLPFYIEVADNIVC